MTGPRVQDPPVDHGWLAAWAARLDGLADIAGHRGLGIEEIVAAWAVIAEVKRLAWDLDGDPLPGFALAEGLDRRLSEFSFGGAA